MTYESFFVICFLLLLCMIEMTGAWRLAIGLLPLVAATFADENSTGINISIQSSEVFFFLV